MTTNCPSPPVVVRHGGDGLMQRGVHAVGEGGVDGEARTSVARVTALVPQLLLPPPFCTAIGKPHLVDKT